MELKIKMMAAASSALEYLRSHKNVTDEEVLQHVSDFILDERIKDYNIKFGMIAAATETYKIFQKESANLSDKEILRKVMLRIPEIIENMGNIK